MIPATRCVGTASAACRNPALLVAGDPGHGVVRFAREVAAAVGGPVVDRIGPGPTHVHFTDRLWGASPEAAATTFELAAAAAPLSVTLHDLPQPSDGTGLARRAAAYARVVAAARAVVCCSAHETALLREHTDPAATATVIPHPVDPLPLGARPTDDGAVALLGFVYPGKGHRELVDAVATLPDPPPVVALGRASPGHEGDVAALRRHAAARGVSFEVTGYLADGELLRRMRTAAVPVAAHRHVSASGSIATWIAAGRRPLVADSRYTREVATLRPGCVTRFTDLKQSIAGVGSTWLGPDADTGPDGAAVAAAHRAFWAGVDW